MIAIVAAGLAAVLGFLPAAPDRPLSIELREADWGISNWAMIRQGQVGVTHALRGDELRVYLLSKSQVVIGKDQVRSLTPSFPGSYYLVSSFDSGSQNRFGGYFNSFLSSPSSASATIKRWDDGRRALTLDFLRSSSGFSGMWVHLFDFRKPAGERVYFDASPFASIAFWVRGSRGDERILVKASDAAWEKKEDALPIGEISDFLPGRRVETSWQPAVIPLKRLPQGLNRRLLASIVFEVEGNGQGRIAIKDLAFCMDSQPPPLSPPYATPDTEIPQQKAMWVWNTRDILASPEQQSELVAFCRRMMITHLFLQLPNESANLGAAGEIQLEEGKWKPFLERLNSNGLRAYALDGSKNYALPEWRARVLLTVDNVIRFNRSVEPQQRFQGIHCDIEPHLLEGFHGPQREKILRNYLRLLKDIAKKTRPSRLAFGADIPFWYDVPDELSGRPFLLEFDGRRKLVSEHVIDLVDHVGVMDYRTSAYGADAILAHAQNELAYAAQKGKQVFVGLETSELPDENLFDFEGVPHQGLPPNPPPGRWVLVAPGGTTAIVCLVSEFQWSDVRRLLQESNRPPQSAFWWPVAKITSVSCSKLTFAHLGIVRLNQVMAEAQEELPHYRSFAGFAIHDYLGYRKLLDMLP
jgi:hypothetical protein